MWPDQGENFGDVTSGDPLQFFTRELFRRDANAAFRATVWQAGHGAFPRHPYRQGGHFPQTDVSVIAKTSFRGAPGRVMLNSISGKHACIAAIHFDRNTDRERALRELEPFAEAWFELPGTGSFIELCHG